MNPKEIFKEIAAATGFKIGDRVSLVAEFEDSSVCHVVTGVVLVMRAPLSFEAKLEVVRADNLEQALSRSHHYYSRYVVSPEALKAWKPLPLKPPPAPAALPAPKSTSVSLANGRREPR